MPHSSAPVLNAVMTTFKPEYIAQKALMFAEMVKDCEETGLPKVVQTYNMFTAYSCDCVFLSTVQAVRISRQLCSGCRSTAEGEVAAAKCCKCFLFSPCHPSFLHTHVGMEDGV